jgi:pimeloyl-ACP methyl ester carboxylesterase
MSSLNQQTVRQSRHKIYEKLAKPGDAASIYNNKHYQGEVILEEYLVKQIFQDKSSGFYALGLVSNSENKPPVLVIRGFGTWGTLKDFPAEFVPYRDIPDVVRTQSNAHFQAAQKNGVIEWLKIQALHGKPSDVVGQSLGGKVGQQLTVEVPEVILSLVTFNSIGISAEECERYKGNVEIYHYINPADLVPYMLGESFLPGTILKVYNPTISKSNLLGQHNELVLNKPETLIKEIENESFYRNQDLYKFVKDYGKTVQREIGELQEIAKQEEIETATSLNKSNQTPLSQQFDNSRQVIQQEFRQINQAVRQHFLQDVEAIGSDRVLQEQVRYSVEVIQKEVEKLSESVHQEFKGSGKSFKDFRQTLQQGLTDVVETVQKKFDNLFQ